jgi:hypothetical protein
MQAGHDVGSRAGWRAVAVVVGAFIALTAVMTWPYVNYAAFGESTYGGDQRLIVWTLAWDNHALLSADRLFQSNLFFPAADSLRYNEHLFGLSLFTLPWAMAGASPVLAHNVLLWSVFPLNGLAAFLLFRRFTASDLAAFTGSLAFTFSFYVMSHANAHLHLVWLWPIPLSLLLLVRWFDRPTRGGAAAWTALVLLEALSSWYLAVLVLVANGLMGVVLVAADLTRSRLAGSRPSVWPRRILHLAGAALVVALAVYPFARHYTQIQGEPTERLANSAQIDSYVVPPQNSIVGRWWFAHVNRMPREIWGEQTLFAGWLALLLAAAGGWVLIRSRIIDRRAWVFPLLTVVAVLFSFGPSLPVLGESALAPFSWLAALPGLAGMRAPARFAALVMLGIGGLVAIGSDALVRRTPRRGRVMLLVLIPLMLFEWFVVDFPAGKPRPLTIAAIYRAPQLAGARAMVSLPDYWGQPDWFRGGDYLYYSMAHWRPIVNGFGRTAPRGYDDLLATVRAFPASISQMQEIGIEYVVVHAARYPDHGRDLLAAAAARPDCRLLQRSGDDYLFDISTRSTSAGVTR